MPSLNESALRARAQRAGSSIHRSRDRSVHGSNLGQYMLVEVDCNFIVLGERFNASLEDIAEYLTQLVQGRRPVPSAFSSAGGLENRPDAEHTEGYG
jgi:hypothetical protein